MKAYFNTLWGDKIHRKHGESKKDFIKRCKANKHGYTQFMSKYTPKHKTPTQRMKAEEDHMVARWDKRHPMPEPDLFGNHKEWEKTREAAIERIRDIVVSRYDKLILTGRFKRSENEFYEKTVATIKDINGEGHKVNELPKTSKLLMKATSLTQTIYEKSPSLVATTLHDHVRKRGRIILPCMPRAA